jgi:putative tryptophan/tyrosine transport system substrate-binding protein
LLRSVKRVATPILRRVYQPFFEELRRLGHVEGKNLVVERYSGEGRAERFADLAREIAGRKPDVIVASTNKLALAARAVDAAIPIVWIGVDPVAAGSRRAWRIRREHHRGKPL